MRFSLALAFLLAACADPPPSVPPPLAPPPRRPTLPIVAGRSIATRVAFDLAALADGAVLAWGIPVDRGGGIDAITLDPWGRPRGEEIVITRGGLAAARGTDEGPTLVEDLVLTTAGARVGVAWIVRRGASLTAQATISSAGLEGFAPTRDLGASIAIPLDAPSRGRLAAYVAPEGAAMVAYRAPPARCQASTGTCAIVRAARLDGEAPPGRVGPSEILSPCEPLIVGAIGTADAFFQGTCHLDAERQPATMVISLYPAISLATPLDVAPGCTPIGMAPGPSGAIAISRCADGIAATQIDRMGQVAGSVHGAALSARCRDGRPVIEIRGTGAPLAMTLTEPVSRIEALLPESVAPAGSRAVWTGEAILLAMPVAGEVRVHRYECELAELVRTDID